jgi:hypothetical protein
MIEGEPKCNGVKAVLKGREILKRPYCMGSNVLIMRGLEICRLCSSLATSTARKSHGILSWDFLKGGGLMPEFANPFSGLAHDRRITREELVRAIRFAIAAEYEAIQLYMQLAESIDHELASTVLREIADEERVHAGEFLRLLKELEPEEDKFYAEGATEVEEQIKEKGKEIREEKNLRAKSSEPDVPFCTTAPSAEHARAFNVDEPCYDATVGDLKKE